MLTEEQFNAGEIDLDRFPIRGVRSADETKDVMQSVATFDPAGTAPGGQSAGESVLRGLFDAARQGDSASVRSAMSALAQSSRGQTCVELGERLLALQSAEQQASIEPYAAKADPAIGARE